MAASLLTQIRQAICANITGALGSAINAYPAPIGNPTTPAAWVIRERTETHQAFNPTDSNLTLVVQVFVGLSDGLDGIALLDEFTGEGSLSVRAAIETADGDTGQTTLGGLVGDLIVTEVSRDRLTSVPGQATAQYLAADFTVEIYTGGTP